MFLLGIFKSMFYSFQRHDLCTYQHVKQHVHLKGPLSCLKKFLATEGPLKMVKNAFCFTLKALFVLKIFKFFSRLLGM